jgi:hypothetical protein
MGEKFYAEEDKQRRLNGTVCMWEGKPVYCIIQTGRRRAGPEEILVAPLPEATDTWKDAPWKVVKYTDPRFSYEAFPLGYINYGGRCGYLMRSPHQQQSAGLGSGNIIIQGDYGLGTDRFLASQAMEDCILGKYPTLKEVLSKGIGAFSRNFAIRGVGRKLGLEYQGNIIGMASTTGPFVLWRQKSNRIISPQLSSMGVLHVIDNS